MSGMCNKATWSSRRAGKAGLEKNHDDRRVEHKLGLLGRKVGMMRIFTDDGDAIPVTVLDVSNNRVTQVKTVESRRLQRHPGGLRIAQGLPCHQARSRPPGQGGRDGG